MSSALTRWADSGAQIWGFMILFGLHLSLDHWWKGSAAAEVAKYAYLSYVPFWMAVKARAGYLRRKPYWTRKSWLRYLRLTAMPVVVLIAVLWVSSFDMSVTWSILGGPRSLTRVFWVVILLGMIFLGVGGLIRALDWLTKGEPSEQFTRTRWFQRRAPAS